jgi:hypothetical protein
MTDKIHNRERSRQEEEDQGIPHMHFKVGASHVNEVALRTCSCNHRKDEISYVIKKTLAIIP